MNKQSNDTRTPPLLHAARLVFPPLAALVVLVLMGGALIFLAICRPAREAMERRTFL